MGPLDPSPPALSFRGLFYGSDLAWFTLAPWHDWKFRVIAWNEELIVGPGPVQSFHAPTLPERWALVHRPTLVAREEALSYNAALDLGPAVDALSSMVHVCSRPMDHDAILEGIHAGATRAKWPAAWLGVE